MKRILLSFIIIFTLGLSLLAQTIGELTVSTTTSESGGNYFPRNIVAIWIEDSNNQFVKTLLVNADKRKTHLNNWQSSTKAANTEYNQVDAITGATNSKHATRSCTWNGTDINGTLVEDGTYTLHLELTDDNRTGNYSSISFNKGSSSEIKTPSDQPSFSNISLQWTPATTGIKINQEKESGLAVYPNPGKGIFTIIQNNITVVEVRNLKGQLVYEGQNKTIDISQQPNGIYLVSLKSNKAYSTTRVLKK